jgi:hypothetical protein
MPRELTKRESDPDLRRTGLGGGAAAARERRALGAGSSARPDSPAVPAGGEPPAFGRHGAWPHWRMVRRPGDERPALRHLAGERLRAGRQRWPCWARWGCWPACCRRGAPRICLPSRRCAPIDCQQLRRSLRARPQDFLHPAAVRAGESDPAELGARHPVERGIRGQRAALWGGKLYGMD